MDQKVDKRDQNWTVGARPAPFFPEKATKQPFVQLLDNYYANDPIL